MSDKNLFNCLKASIVAFLLLFFQPLFAQKNFDAITQYL